MIDDLTFGDKCASSNLSQVGTGASEDYTGLVNSTGSYYGRCSDYRVSATPANRGYLYNYQAAVNKPGAYYSGPYAGNSVEGKANQGGQGICPPGFVLPTLGDATNLFRVIGVYNVYWVEGTGFNAIGGSRQWNYGSINSWEYVLDTGSAYRGGRTDFSYVLVSDTGKEENDVWLPYARVHYIWKERVGGAVRCVRGY
jgi:hypothetical protein